ncbi:glycosyltransferase family 2 protein [Curtobacterium sp. C1]|uniref:glycosyltransferase family 2 protein n=1 Tax=Curtobacterium sp. C1 TaxID=2898151 RepID=UPI003FA415D7
MPRISVVIPAHNAGGTLRSSVRSTLFALPKDSEVLIYDDASTDDTRDVADRLADQDSRVKVFVGVGRNIGAARARNLLIGESDSEFVAALDADDVCLPNRFLGFERAMRDLDLLFAPIVRFGAGRRLHVPRPAPLSPAALPLALFIINPLPQSTMLARRGALNGSKTYVHGPAEDYELWMRLAAEGRRIRLASVANVAYRHHPSQATAKSSYTSRVSRNPELIRAWSALGESLGLPAAWTVSNEEISTITDQLIAALPRGSDRRRVHRLTKLESAFPFLH